MRIQGKKPQCNAGFSLLELIIVIGLIAFLMVIAIDRILPIRVDAERVAVENITGVLRSALGIKFAHSMIHGRYAEAENLVGSNPMDLLAEQPGNYLGSFRKVDADAIRPGSWYFNENSRALVYKVWNTGHFSGGLRNPARARFVIRPVYGVGGNRGKPGRRLEGLKLDVVEPFGWSR